MHIAHVASFYSVPALSPSSAVRSRGIAYRAAGHEFSVIVPGVVASVQWTEYGTVVTVPARGPVIRRGFVRIPIAIRRALDRLVPDRLEVADRLSFRQLGAWARSNHVPAVLLADDVPAKRSSDAALKDYERVVCGSESTTLPSTHLDSGRILTVEPGVDLEIFTPLRHNSALRDTSGADVIVVCAAPLTTGGAVAVAIEAIRAITILGIDAHLVIVGDGPLRNRLERSASGLPVQFLSADDLSLAERAEVFATADFAFVTVGGTIGHGITLESLASGTPAIVSAHIQRHIDFREGGGLSTSADPAHIAQATLLLRTEPVERRRRAARETALPFDAMPLARAMIDLHESLG